MTPTPKMRGTGPMWGRALLLTLFAAALVPPAFAKSWSASDQYVWEAAWRDLDRAREETTANNYKLAKIEEQMAAQAQKVAPGDRIVEWVGILRNLDLVALKGEGAAVVGEVEFTDPALKSPHVARFVKLREEISRTLDQDLLNVKTGAMVRVTGTVAPAPAVDRKKPARERDGFLDKCADVWQAIVRGARGEKKKGRDKPLQRKDIFDAPEGPVAALHLDLERLDPSWTPERKRLYDQALALKDECEELQARRAAVERALLGPTLSRRDFALEPPEVVSTTGEEVDEALEPEPAPAIRFEALVCKLESHAVRLNLPRDEGQASLAEIKNTLDLGASRISSERFFERSLTLSKLEGALAHSQSLVSAAERDVERLRAFIARNAPEESRAEEALAGIEKEVPRNVLFAVRPAVLPGAAPGVGGVRPAAVPVRSSAPARVSRP